MICAIHPIEFNNILFIKLFFILLHNNQGYKIFLYQIIIIIISKQDRRVTIAYFLKLNKKNSFISQLKKKKIKRERLHALPKQ